jgi:hypothetical protein
LEKDNKFVVVLNRSYELPQLVSGLGHVTAGLVASLSKDLEELSFVTYETADGVAYPWISDWPFIILKARGGQLQTLRETLAFRDMPHSTYLETMLTGGSAHQQKITKEQNAAEIPLLALATFGDRTTLDELTKKFSLWR